MDEIELPAFAQLDDGAWLCVDCGEPAEPVYDADECEVCGDRRGCGCEHTLRAIVCHSCGLFVVAAEP